VPQGFPAYVRILHPARDDRDNPVRWADVAAATGRPMPSGVQFAEIALRPPGSAIHQRLSTGPDEGTLDAADSTALSRLLRKHSADADHCWFCLWEGYGWDAREPLVDPTPVMDGPPPGAVPAAAPDHLIPQPIASPDDPIPPEVRMGPKVELPGRSYVLYSGAVEQGAALVEWQGQIANLWWPADRSWFVATELYGEWTYVGGSRELIDALVADDQLEAQPADPDEPQSPRLLPWTENAVDAAVADLLAAKPATIATAAGRIAATARLPGPIRAGELRITRYEPDGTESGGAWTSLGRDRESARRQIHFQLRWAVIDLLG
jgi:hypothetical protein